MRSSERCSKTVTVTVLVVDNVDQSNKNNSRSLLHVTLMRVLML
jgi:hypothetical protein